MFFINSDLSLKEAQICVPLTAHSLDDLVLLVDNAVRERPDLLEWRVDGFGEIASQGDLTSVLRAIVEHGKGTPILFTWRSHRDGGKHIADKDYKQLSVWAMESGLIGLIDLELSMEPKMLHDLINHSKKHGVETVISHHDFKETPRKAEILSLLAEMVAAGGNAVKFAVSPNSVEDVLTAMETVVEFKKSNPAVPIIGISMGRLGSVTRAWGGTLGTALIFATVDGNSAPGQLSAEEIRHFSGIL